MKLMFNRKVQWTITDIEEKREMLNSSTCMELKRKYIYFEIILKWKTGFTHCKELFASLCVF